MKKALLFYLFIVLALHNCEAQWLPIYPLQNLTYTNNSAGNKPIVIIDSSIYAIRAGGLEEFNVANQVIDYHWAGYYELNNIVADTGHSYVYLKDRKYIGRYNENTLSYENIWTGTNKQFTDIDVAPDGKVWAVTANMSHEVAVYDGVNWTFYPYTPYLYYGFNGIKIVDDTLAYLMESSSRFYAFHNGTFDSLYTYVGYYFKDWDADHAGNLWIAAENKLVHVYGGTAIVYDTSNTPLGNDKFLQIKIGSNGHVWTCGNSNKLLEYNGVTWQIRTLPLGSDVIVNFALDDQNNPWVITKGTNKQLYMYNGNTWLSEAFPFMPLRNITALGASSGYNQFGFFATREGFFTVHFVNPSSFYITSFSDTSVFQFADDITCFTDNALYYYSSFGSNQGISNLNGFNNSMLPNDTINYSCYDNGTYYIATNNGLLTYNGILYNTINTSNSPLPSNKITFVTTSNLTMYDNTNALYVGTDKGLALYKNGQWIVYDTTNVLVSSFYVTGAVASWSDSAVYISTMGSGLIKVFPQGSYELFNTSNGTFLDDTLYYVKNIQLASCGSYMIIGTSHNGIAHSNYFQPDNFNYQTNFNGVVPINSSKLAATSLNFGFSMVATDSLIYLLYPCGSVAENNPKEQLMWFQHDGQLIITVPQTLYGDGTILLTDMLGKTLIEKDCDTRSGKIQIDISNFASGVYIFRLNTGTKMGFSKVSLFRN